MSTKKTSFPREKIKILFLEGIHPSAAKTFEDAGYKVELLAQALSEDELCARIEGVHLLGIRSKTQVTEKVLTCADSLLTLGCFCIGTNQVALEAACQSGVPVFNAPFSNTRSVAELTLAEMVMLARRAAHRSQLLHAGKWEKSASQSYEVRGKVVGIIGYGHIGPQVGLLAEAFGMRVQYYDVARKLPLGNACACGSLSELLSTSDFVTLHVPETPETQGMIGKGELRKMRRGSYLLNLSRGSVVDLAALREAIESGHIAGSAIDVFPHEPNSNDEHFENELRGLPNVILTPHVGGSTQEAQKNIGVEVAEALLQFTEMGVTTGAVNFPQVALPHLDETHRVLNIHRNVPGVLKSINSLIAEMGANIQAQYLGTNKDVGYLIMDVGPNLSLEVKEQIEALDENIKTRVLF